MAKKKTRTTTTTTSNYSIVKTCAFWALLLAGIAQFISFILQMCYKIFSEKVNSSLGWLAKISSVCSLISQIALFITVFLAAWDYVKGKSKGWRTVYWVFLIISILGFVGFQIFVFI